jgi:nitrogen fixation NifU-like protein
MSYSDRVLQYFLDPAHAGEMESPDGIGPVGDISCGDFFVMYIRVSEGRLAEISYQVFGCPAAIATCEAVADMATGKTLEEAQEITDETVAEFLGGLPEVKLHCSNSAAEALHRAIADYWTRQGRERLETSVTASAEQHPYKKKEVEENATR